MPTCIRTKTDSTRKWSENDGNSALEILEDLTAYKIAYTAVDQKTESTHKSLKRLVDVAGIEPPTPCLQSRCSPS
jgi:hypothetical protein